MRARFLFVLLLTVIRISDSFSQDSTFYYSAALKAIGSSSNTPLWLHSNQYGSVPTNGSYIGANLGFYKNYKVPNPRFFQWSAGFESILYAGKSSNAFFTDLFVAGKAGPIELSVGQRKDFMGLADSTLSSGSFAMSNNYRPYPRLKLATSGFVNLIPGKQIIGFNFSYSDGLLGAADINYGNVKRISDAYLHQKSLYIRLGGPRHKLNLYGGFNHQAMWGGEDKIFSGGLERSEAYRYVIFGKPWAASRVGNHFGTIDVAATWNTDNWNLFLYRQSIYEDGSLAELSNIKDGLNGLRFKRNRPKEETGGFFLSTILLEYVYTKDQGGSVFDFTTGVFGRDNYFNHYVYSQGWSYRARSLGTPLISPQYLTRDNVPENINRFTVNNRLSAFHLGLIATIDQATVLFKGTVSDNIGTYQREFKPSLKQSSFLIQAERPLPILNKSILSISLAADFGKLYTNNYAVSIGIRKTGFIK